MDLVADDTYQGGVWVLHEGDTYQRRK